MRIATWNVNSVRLRLPLLEKLVAQHSPDVICLQETKAQPDQVDEALAALDGFEVFSNSAVKKGYSGTAILTRKSPQNVIMDMGIEEHDQEGRVIAAEFPRYWLVTVYTPNSGNELKRLDYRQQWDRDFLAYLKSLEETKPVVVCGDLNVAHTDIDLARPKPNYNKSAGYMQEEIDGFNNLMTAGFLDSFRVKNPDTIKYSWWSYRAGAREKNIGWRIDYFLTSAELKSRIKAADIHDEVHGSDHCPVMIDLK